MPGYDGTGPLGAGPLTGIGRGYCVLKIPETQDEKPTGFAGLAGRPITDLPNFLWTENAHLHLRFKQVQFALREINYRIEILKRSIGRDK